ATSMESKPTWGASTGPPTPPGSETARRSRAAPRDTSTHCQGDAALAVIDVSALVFHELTASPAHRALLRRFSDEAYAPEFPDPDERESLVNIERYLELKAQGWYGDNAYHVVVAEDDGMIVGGAISDYLADPNAGVVEFLVVTPAARGQGLGRRLLDVTEGSIDDAGRRLGRPRAGLI